MVSEPLRLRLPPDPASTERLGEHLGAHLVPGDVVGLTGELGAGKTTLVRGLARGLQVTDPEAISSPTYLLVVEHPGPIPLLHADAYLPAKLQGFLDDGGLDYLLDPRAVAVIEWAQNVQKSLSGRTLWVDIAMAADGGRTVELRPSAATAFPWLAAVPKIWGSD